MKTLRYGAAQAPHKPFGMFLCGTGVLLLIAFSMASVVAQAQGVLVTPKEPRWGDTLTIRYNTKQPGAKISLRHKAFAWLSMTTADGAIIKRSAPAMAQDSFWVAKYVLEDSIAVGNVGFMTAEMRDFSQSEVFFARRRDGIAARSATLARLSLDSTAFDKELVLYPDNYRAYNRKWSMLEYKTFKDKPEFVLKEVRKDMEKLERVSSVSASLLMAKADGYRRLGQVLQQHTMAVQLLKQFPRSEETPSVLFECLRAEKKSNEAKSNNEAGKTPQNAGKTKPEQALSIQELRQQMYGVIARAPESPLAKGMLTYAWYLDTTLTVRQMEPVMRVWAAREPDNPEPYNALVQMAVRLKEHHDSLDVFAQRACDLVVRPDVLVKYMLDGERKTANVFQNAAEAFTLQQRFGQAIAALRIAQQFCKEDDNRAEQLEKEGRIWLKLEQPSQAQRVYLNAAAFGSKEAKDSLKALYVTTNGSTEGFEAFLKQKTDSISALAQKPALPFSIKDLNGNEHSLASLRGKVVVVNFWFISCPPCRMEIPGLNKLVKEFSGKDVVFLALALDDKKDLKEFLKKTPFDYTIVPEASKVADMYGVQGYPTHVVINRQGMVAARLIGGSETRHEDIRPFIAQALER